MSRRWISVVVGLMLALGAVGRPALAQPVPGPTVTPPSEAAEADTSAALTQRIGVWRLDALGMEAELVTRLEALFRSELDRLAATPIPPRRDTERLAGRALADCTGQDRCLADIGKKVGVEVMVSGSVAAMGDSYVLDIKAVDVATATQLRRIATDPLRGTPDDLIDSVRVAAYRLLAPAELHGSISILSDIVGAEVKLDGKLVGKTPLLAPLRGVALGPHELRLDAEGSEPFVETVDVRFQKTSRVLVSLTPTEPEAPPAPIVRTVRRSPWYSRWYAWVAVGAVAIAGGLAIGSLAGSADVINCDAGGAGC